MLAVCIVCRKKYDTDDKPQNRLKTCGNHSIKKDMPIDMRYEIRKHFNLTSRMNGNLFLFSLKKTFQNPVHQLNQCYWIDVS